MRFLFVMRYPGYLRYYDTVVHELARRGHEVVIGFGSLRQQEALSALDGVERVTVLGRVPARRDEVARLAYDFSRTADTFHYLHPRMLSVRRHSARKPSPFRTLERLDSLPAPLATAGRRAFVALERALPSGAQVEEQLRKLAADAVLVTPLVEDVQRQAELIRSARQLGIPSAVGISSWDNLTTASLLHQLPDRVFVWNESQRTEAIELHGVPDERVVTTGAQPFDRWFGRSPSRTREEFLEAAGLPADRPMLLYTGSVAKDAKPTAEKAFVQEWIARVRASEDPVLRRAGIILRPHPYNAEHWSQPDVAGLDDVALWPSQDANPVDEGDRADYFDSLFHSAAIVGINTSAMVEAAIVGRPVLTIRIRGLEDLQANTVHFHYLLPENGGFLYVSESLEEHTTQLSGILTGGDGREAEREHFVRGFIRPYGIDEPATPRVADAIEQLACTQPCASSPSAAAALASGAWLRGRRLKHAVAGRVAALRG